MSHGKRALADWTTGAEAIVYQSCAACAPQTRQKLRWKYCKLLPSLIVSAPETC